MILIKHVNRTPFIKRVVLEVLNFCSHISLRASSLWGVGSREGKRGERACSDVSAI